MRLYSCCICRNNTHRNVGQKETVPLHRATMVTNNASQNAISAREVAEAISNSEEGQKLSFERVRHWAREGLLPLFGDKHPIPTTQRKARIHAPDAVFQQNRRKANDGVWVFPERKVAINLVENRV